MSRSKQIPEVITDNNNNIKLTKEQYLGTGSFGRCYALKCAKTGKKYAGKFLDKCEIENYKVTDKITQEINIHRNLNHENIVSFKSCLEDKDFIFIILELCSYRSMSELIDRRQFISIFEAKYYMKQIVSAVIYLHKKKIIHRDLKLDNLFINHKMIIKVGDFGLAVKVTDDKTNRRSLCGTPNYIAPEVLSRQGHSYEVDIWALGCILYTLLVGTPPFQTETLKETYSLISKCKYNIPEPIKNCTAADFITCTLQRDPKKRPSINELTNHEFLNVGFIPKKLPSSCIVMPPRTKSLLDYSDRHKKYFIRSPLKDINFPMCLNTSMLTDIQLFEMLKKLHDKIKDLLLNGVKRNKLTDDTQNPSLRPFIWINSWMDYSYRYGFGYQLNDNTVGALFNDSTSLLILPSGKNARYFQNDGFELYFNTDNITEIIKKKMKILKSFRKFMFYSLKNAYEDADLDDEPLSSLPTLRSWVNTENVVGMFLSNGTLQLNFRTDHIKLILCPIMNAVTIITNSNQLSTFQLDLLKTYGCDELLIDKLSTATKIIKLINDKMSENGPIEVNKNNNEEQHEKLLHRKKLCKS